MCNYREYLNHKACYPNLSLWSLLGQTLNKQSAYGGIGLSYNLMKYKIDNIKFLIGLNDKDSRFKTNMEAVLNSTPNEGGNDDLKPLFKFYYDITPFDNIRVIGNMEFDRSKPKEVKWNITEEFSIDNLTKIKTKVINYF